MGEILSFSFSLVSLTAMCAAAQRLLASRCSHPIESSELHGVGVEMPTWQRGPVGLAFGSALVLLALVNLNLWIPLRALFPILAVLSTLALLGLLMRREWRAFASHSARCVMLPSLVGLITAVVLFDVGRWWLLEGPNHDSLDYYTGMTWVLDRPFWVDPADVHERWGLGRCGEGTMWIGNDCALHRGGTMTMLGLLLGGLSAQPSAGAMFLIMGFAGWLMGLAVHLAIPRTAPEGVHRTAVLQCIAVVAVLSTAGLSALVNSNFATLLATCCIGLALAAGMRSDLSLRLQAVLMGLWIAVGTHFYAESTYYSGLVAVLILLVRTIGDSGSSKRRWIELAQALACLAAIAVLGGNVAMWAAFKTLFVLKGMSVGGDWAAWYIDQSPWVWLGSFVAGELLGVSRMSTLALSFSGLIASGIACWVCIRTSATRPALLALVITSTVLVLFVEIRQYRYGEHKILQLLGFSWTLLCLYSVWKLATIGVRSDIRIPSRRLSAMLLGSMLAVLTYVQIDYLRRTQSLMRDMEAIHAVPQEMVDMISNVRRGDKVLIDAKSWPGADGFQKVHYLAFMLTLAGATPVMTASASDPYAYGYLRKYLENTLASAGGVDWLIRSRWDGEMLVKNMPGIVPMSVNDKAVLYKVDPSTGVAISRGDGWTMCHDSCHLKARGAVEMWVAPGAAHRLVVEFTAGSREASSEGWSWRACAKGCTPLNGISQVPVRLALQPGFNRLEWQASLQTKSVLPVALRLDAVDTESARP